MLKIVIVYLMLGASLSSFAVDRYVATNGSDSNSGTSTHAPFATIQKAADVMGAGDTCYIRGGNYHEAVVINGLNGTPENPVRFTAYQDETVTLDGTRSLADLGSTGWTSHSGNIYKTTLTNELWQLFDDGEMMIMARWPNAFLHDGTIWDQQGTWGRGHDGSSSNGTMVDNVNYGHDLAATGLDMTGAMGVMNIGSFRTWPRKVLSHSGGSNTFTYNTVPGGGYRTKLGYYYLECKLNLLDAEREWFYDTATKTLYLWAPGGAIPSGNIRGKTQTYAFNVSNSDWLVIDGLNFFGTTFTMTGCSDCTVENCNLQFPSFSRRMLGSEADIEFANMQAGHSSPGNTLRNCVFENSDGQAIRMNGAGCVIDNNHFHKIDFSCAGLPNLGNTIQVEIGSSGSLIRRNTIDTAGASETIAPGKAATVEYNRVTNIGLLQSDGACVHCMVPEAPNSTTRYNWFHDHDKYSVRFDGSPGGEQGLVHHNVVWSSNTMRIKGDFNQVYNNFGYEPLFSKGIINIATDKGGNANTITRNNAADDISPATLLSSGDPLPGTESHNWNGSWTGTDVRDQVRDVANLDFRPKAGSAFIDAGTNVAGVTVGWLGSAPDIGPYEYGASSYWIAGRKRAQASTPVPPDSATNVRADADLMWLDGYEAASNAVYFGANSGSLVFQGVQTNTIFTPGALLAGSEYFWRVDAIGPGGAVTGAVWSFTVEGVPVVENGLVYTEHTNAPIANAVTWWTNHNSIWNAMSVVNNDGSGNEKMYGQSFVAPETFALSSVSFHATGDTQNFGDGQMLQLSILEDTDSNSVPDTVLSGELSVSFISITGSTPWKKLTLLDPLMLESNKAYAFVYTLTGPISNLFRVATDNANGYAHGKGISTDCTAGDFPNPLPPALNNNRDIAFTIQRATPQSLYAAWAKGYAISGQDGYTEDPDGDALNNLAEYGLGGVPDNPNDAPGVVPSFENSEYVYHRRTDAAVRGLTYLLEECTNLVSNDWNAVTNLPTGIAPLGFGFEAVTNQIPVTENSLFIRLGISLD